jgi:hypothetical protein
MTKIELLAAAEALKWAHSVALFSVGEDNPVMRKIGEQADALLAQAAAMPEQEPVASLYVDGEWGQELQNWEIDANQKVCERLNEQYAGNPTILPLYAHPDPRVAELENECIALRAWQVTRNRRLAQLEGLLLNACDALEACATEEGPDRHEINEARKTLEHIKSELGGGK